MDREQSKYSLSPKKLPGKLRPKPLLGVLFKLTGFKKRSEIKKAPLAHQTKVLHDLLSKARLTQFGRHYEFDKIIKEADTIAAFREKIPFHTYEDMHKWWKKTLKGEEDVSWPGRTEYFALSSGTSEGSSKYIPVTKAMLRSIQRVGVRQMLSLRNCPIRPDFFQRNILMLGGSSDLDSNGVRAAGDLSGITTGRLPFWFRPFYKPGREISQIKDWEDKLDRIAREAPRWDVGALVGVPAWIQLVLEKIIKIHKAKNIHDVWPNLQLFVHGGVAFEPYRKSFEKLLGKPLIYLETYLASEGFIAFQEFPDDRGLTLFIRKGIFFEFIPFNVENFDPEGRVIGHPKTYTVNEVQEGIPYALVMTTCAGAWRYLIGDVIEFVDKDKLQIKITGRTKHFLSLCGEHLSVDNMNKAVEMLSEDVNLDFKEFTVTGFNLDNHFGHHWYLGVNNASELTYNTEEIARKLDHYLKELNDDYKTEREHFLQHFRIDVLDTSLFYEYLKAQWRIGAQVKFPRVLRGKQVSSWQEFLTSRNVEGIQELHEYIS